MSYFLRPSIALNCEGQINLTMKSFRTLAVLIAIGTVFFIFSCSKDSDPPPVNLGSTIWSDSAIVGTVKYKSFILDFKDDGTATVKFGSLTPFPGFWNKLPTSQVVNFYFTESATHTWKGQGTINGTSTKIESGILTRLTPSTISGAFVATKQ